MMMTIAWSVSQMDCHTCTLARPYFKPCIQHCALLAGIEVQDRAGFIISFISCCRGHTFWVTYWIE